MKPKIKEIIIVEGKDDIAAVKQAVDAHVIAVHGYSSFKKETIEKLKNISLNNDIIVLTDPDFAGKKIRDLISQNIPDAKHAFISRTEGTKKGNIGVENANKEAIIEALKNSNIKFLNKEIEKQYSHSDLVDNKLCYGENSKIRREQIGSILRIGYYNSKQLLNALNNFNISREIFDKAIKELNYIAESRYKLWKKFLF